MRSLGFDEVRVFEESGLGYCKTLSAPAEAHFHRTWIPADFEKAQ
jgi:hypothetical protein